MVVGERPVSDASEQPSDSILIWGSGAMGGAIGASLSLAGHDVTFVDQDEAHVAAMNKNGLEIIGPVQSFRVPAHAYLPADVEGSFSTALLCVKAHHTRDALVELAPHVAKRGCVVSIQNGLNELEIAAANLDEERTVGAFVNFGADLMEPGVVLRGNRGAFVLGELDGSYVRTTGGPGAAVSGLRTQCANHGQHFRISLEQAGVWCPPLRHGDHAPLDRRSLRLSLTPAPTSLSLLREVVRVAEVTRDRVRSVRRL